jgi:hypothetical protein
MLITCESKNDVSDIQSCISEGYMFTGTHWKKRFALAKQNRPSLNMYVAWQDVILSLGILGAINGALFLGVRLFLKSF